MPDTAFVRLVNCYHCGTAHIEGLYFLFMGQVYRSCCTRCEYETCMKLLREDRQ